MKKTVSIGFEPMIARLTVGCVTKLRHETLYMINKIR